MASRVGVTSFGREWHHSSGRGIMVGSGIKGRSGIIRVGVASW